MPAQSLLRADGVSHAYGAHTVITDLSLTASAGQRLGLLGENGAGKSTLLRLLAGVEVADSGVIHRPSRTGYLPQEVRFDVSAPLSAIIEEAVAETRAIELELTDAAASLTTDPDAEARYAAALEAAEAADIWSLDARRDTVLAGLGVAGIPLDRSIGDVSGGQRSRVALAALLLGQPDALILDEPTNHLDDDAVEFLVSRLRDWRGAIVFASHDRAFLDEVASDLLDIDPSRLGATRFGGTYTEYLQAKAEERARWEATFVAEERELAHLTETAAVTARTVAHGRGPRDNDKFITKFKGANVQRAVSRRVKDAEGRITDLLERRAEEPPPVLAFAGIPRGSQPLEGELANLRNVSVHGRLDLPALTIDALDRLLVTGQNGAGKSTLLGVLAGHIAPDAGTVTRRRGLRVALLQQDVQWQDGSRTPRDLYDRALGAHRAGTVPLDGLGLLRTSDLDRPVGALSIGQQRRVALALIIARPPHLFLLDEPTNHLSLTLATELEDALGTYPGAVVIASHDRWLRRRWSGRELRL
ncbi:macrolide transport system ATP-binding/permease protein [Microbacteriaceae bacterium SG_E_30_P1]|uniref:Macrolide transport system ATP-binding/permease protein n=1 Tax=Antiquaquibacter oligotrophicus TaxID=2880260 RepID=A0ABT6KNI3_9MICO|nr:ABC-F family ATP-binding cassette domain-containing protein [Antiquaquibacter oligotrophicus]MDH6181561.1 macrolide transport system ATP-binding/permease protein [Antiquaquibacter oligotrophicus]UDF12751.1 ATP-binding cassette domain-containing protein [Antiquaquibacter oligotrophicus]